jgi:hypothetical protein
MKTLLSQRLLAILGAMVISAIGVTPYETALAVHSLYSAVEAHSAGWVLAVHNAGVRLSI